MTFDIDAMRKAAKGATEGPWVAALESGCHGIIAQSLPEGGANMVALVGNDEATKEREPMRFANAALIALAPDMAQEIERLTASLVEIAETEFSPVRHFTGPSPEDEFESTVDASLLEAIIDEARETLDGKGKSEMDNLRETNMSLVAALATARDDALKEAADEVRDWQAYTRYTKERISEEMAQSILALSKQGTGA